MTTSEQNACFVKCELLPSCCWVLLALNCLRHNDKTTQVLKIFSMKNLKTVVTDNNTTLPKMVPNKRQHLHNRTQTHYITIRILVKCFPVAAIVVRPFRFEEYSQFQEIIAVIVVHLKSKRRTLFAESHFIKCDWSKCVCGFVLKCKNYDFTEEYSFTAESPLNKFVSIFFLSTGV